MDEAAEDRHIADSNTWSPRNHKLADQWISRCLVGHERCNRKTAKERWLPIRLLDIEFPVGSENVRLIETKDMMQEAR